MTYRLAFSKEQVYSKVKVFIKAEDANPQVAPRH